MSHHALLENFEEILGIATRRILAGMMEDADRVSLYQLALALVGETILTDDELIARIDPEVLAALHQLALLADPTTDADALNAFTRSLEA